LKLKLLEADLTIIVYDTTDEETWKNVERLWLPMVNEIYNGDLAKGIFIVGTKVDMLLPHEKELLEERRCSDPKNSSLVSKYLL
jgi:GTPase SAR1 family protein